MKWWSTSLIPTKIEKNGKKLSIDFCSRVKNATHTHPHTFTHVRGKKKRKQERVRGRFGDFFSQPLLFPIILSFFFCILSDPVSSPHPSLHHFVCMCGSCFSREKAISPFLSPPNSLAFLARSNNRKNGGSAATATRLRSEFDRIAKSICQKWLSMISQTPLNWIKLTRVCVSPSDCVGVWVCACVSLRAKSNRCRPETHLIYSTQKPKQPVHQHKRATIYVWMNHKIEKIMYSENH